MSVLSLLRALFRGTSDDDTEDAPHDEKAHQPPDGEVPDPDAAVELPIDGVLDLHYFSPKEVRTLVPDYLEECHKRGITAVRIIHGKGTGALKRSVHALLDRSPLVQSYRTAGIDAGGWGATLVDLVAQKEPVDPDAP